MSSKYLTFQQQKWGFKKKLIFVLVFRFNICCAKHSARLIEIQTNKFPNIHLPSKFKFQRINFFMTFFFWFQSAFSLIFLDHLIRCKSKGCNTYSWLTRTTERIWRHMWDSPKVWSHTHFFQCIPNSHDSSTMLEKWLGENMDLPSKIIQTTRTWLIVRSLDIFLIHFVYFHLACVCAHVLRSLHFASFLSPLRLTAKRRVIQR